ncbi:MAG: hypothetical protein J0L84_20945, partial [Verrucomicrobia bacterium]|nr:hypothetical protein [Verrucomicrobiota bacterium]
SLEQKACKTSWLPFGLKLRLGDLVIGDHMIHEAPADEVSAARSIIQERHRASHWSLGRGSPDFYLVTTDT